MKVVMYADNTLALAVAPLCERLNELCTTLSFAAGSEPFQLPVPMITARSVRARLPKPLLSETAAYDLAIMATYVPYDTNYFYETRDHRVVLSFNAWNTLTDLPVTNGLVFLLVGIIADEVGIGITHHESTSCINDFLWDKTGVDGGMRAAYLCRTCRANTPDDPAAQAVLKDLVAVLDELCQASRTGSDFLEQPPALPGHAGFDVFLCHNSGDKPIIRTIDAEMRAAGVRTWLDEDQLTPGRPWQEELEEQIETVRRAAVFIGGSGYGPWQSAELRAFLNEFRTRGCNVIPVLLPDAPSVPKLPIFLRDMTWVDLRSEYERGLGKLVSAVKAS